MSHFGDQGMASSAGLSDSPGYCYGGPERKTLFITDSETGTILAAKLEVPRKEMYSHM
jgi:gluconolactonase